MREQEYINVRDLSNVLHGYNCLADIVPANQPNIPTKEYQLVIKTISKWKDRMFAACKVNREK